MAIEVTTNFDVNTNKPIDSRYEQNTIAERDLIPSIFRYKGMPCYVNDEDKAYMLVGGITNEHWVDISGGLNRVVVVSNNNNFNGIEVGMNIFDNPKRNAYVLVFFIDASGNVLNFAPRILEETITISSGKTYEDAKLIII